ncbi:MAG TPA: TonB-dependent receptor [Woeseiaceae bacterium]|nr:TonB-dependent receptor [Woeseiaceae bacterium]
MNGNSALRKAVRHALYFSAVVSAGTGASQAAAQEQPDQDVEEITVTGSRIATDPNLVSSAPVSQVSAEELAYRGITRVEDLINDLPQITPELSANESNGATGTATLDLRGLGSDRTLVLVNGHRMGFGDPFALAPDVNQIPGALVEQVELLTGGASSTYGSDAMSGVVNFIMKDDFEGFQIDLQFAGYQHNQGADAVQREIAEAGFEQAPDDVTDGATTSVNMLIGMNSEDGRGNVTGYLGYRDINAITQDSRDFSACALDSGAGGGDGTTCSGSATRFPALITDFAGTYFSVAGDQFVPWDFTYYNFGPLNHFQRPDERYTGGLFANYAVDEHLEGYAEFMFMDDRSLAQIAPSGAFFVTDTIQCSNAFLSAQQQAAIGCAPGVESVPFYIGRRSVEGGPRFDDLRHTSFRSLAGVRGEITDNWSYDAFANFSRLIYSEKYQNDLSTTRIIRSLDVVADPATGQPVCQSVIDGSDPTCVPWNIFQEGGVTPEALDYLVLPLFSDAQLDMDQFVGFVSGDLSDRLTSPWANTGVEMVFGAEYRDESFDFEPDDGFQSGDGAGQGGPIPPVSGSQNVSEVFTEFRVPIAEGMTGVESLVLDLRYRYSDYSTGVDANTYNIGGAWIPMEGIKLRGGFSRAVRAANIREQFEPLNLGLWGGTDPCAGATPELSAAACASTGVTAAQYGSVPANPAGQYNAFFGGNTELQPEKSDSITVGAVLTPSEWVEGLTLSIDYWSIEIEDAIDIREPEFLIRQCAATGDPEVCSLISRGPNGNLWLGQNAVTSTNFNIGFFDVAGVDLVANYALEAGGLGGFDLSFRGTWLEKFDQQPLPGGVVEECAGTWGGSCGRPRPEWKHMFNTVWTTPWEGLALTAAWRYVGEVDEFEQDRYTADGQHYVDLAGTYYADWLGEETVLTAGVSNVTDNDPPVSGLFGNVSVFGNGNTIPATWDALGRYWFVGLTQRF